MMDCRSVIIRKPGMNEVDAIKRIADGNRRAIGFLRTPALKHTIESRNAFIAEHNGEVIGFQTYHHRNRDLQTTLYQKCVSKEFRRKGVGTKLVDAVVEESLRLARTQLFLKCPVDLEANEFHRHYGFILLRTERGKKRKLNVWILKLPIRR